MRRAIGGDKRVTGKLVFTAIYVKKKIYNIFDINLYIGTDNIPWTVQYYNMRFSAMFLEDGNVCARPSTLSTKYIIHAHAVQKTSLDPCYRVIHGRPLVDLRPRPTTGHQI